MCFFVVPRICTALRCLFFKEGRRKGASQIRVFLLIIVQCTIDRIEKILANHISIWYYVAVSRSGGMADAMDSKSIVGDNVWVQVPPSAPRALAMASAFSVLTWDLNGRSAKQGRHGAPSVCAPACRRAAARVRASPTFGTITVAVFDAMIERATVFILRNN